MALELKNVGKKVGADVHIHPTDLTFEPGSFNILLGTTLAGKTTLMQMMAGLEKPTTGEVWFDGRNVTGTAVQKRNVSMVYQQFINYPNMSVFDNIASPLRVARLDAAEIKKRVGDMAELMQISAMLDRRPSELSGGQQQRTAMARALVKDSDLMFAGRTAGQPGLQAARGNARRTAQAVCRAQLRGGLCDHRTDRSAAFGRPHRGHARGQGGRLRPDRRDLPASFEPDVGRGVFRTADQPGPCIRESRLGAARRRRVVEGGQGHLPKATTPSASARTMSRRCASLPSRLSSRARSRWPSSPALKASSTFMPTTTPGCPCRTASIRSRPAALPGFMPTCRSASTLTRRQPGRPGPCRKGSVTWPG